MTASHPAEPGPPFDRWHHDFSPWGFWRDASPTAQQRQAELQRAAVRAHPGWAIGRHCFVSENAAVQADAGRLQVVNGFYRTTRGTYAQFGLPLPYPERVVDTVLTHVTDDRLFAPERQNACNVLDVAHPLWLAGRQTAHRRDDVTRTARRLLRDALGHWTDGQGCGVQAPHPVTRRISATVPGLQGTEMWLAIIWYLADIAGLGGLVDYRPRGVHRPEPAPTAALLRQVPPQARRSQGPGAVTAR